MTQLPTVHPTDKRAAIREITLAVMSCGRCPYVRTRHNPIVGCGDPRSPILIIGESSRQVDDQAGLPFGGRAERKLDSLLERAEINPQHVYKTLAVRCHGGREPEYPIGAAAKRCRPHLSRMVKALRPRVMVLCGLNALKWVLLRWTAEKVDEKTFSGWVGPAYRLREVWGDTKLFVIHSPPELVRSRLPTEEARSVDVLKTVKGYVVAQQTGIDFVLTQSELKLKRRGGQQAKFDWSRLGKLIE